MTSALHWAAWLFTGSAVGAAIGTVLGGPTELLAATAILAALTWLAWGFRVHTDPDAWVTNNERTTDHMAFEWETTEWKRAVNDMTEMERASVDHHAAPGVLGDREDARDEMSRW
ncbi:hypothetical protein [Mycolicibacterium fortuitum]|uniref:hypothetical protein n=1 Tax=Mycolicibacterium fortuitum TaxID=1766 RepID=UPI0026303053|nr:hypothetical protein [Mycolicibacterium fortuitum]